MGDKFKPSEDYGVSVIHKGSKLDADVEIVGFFTMKFINKVLLHNSKKNDKIHNSLLKTIEPFRETSKKNTVVDVEKNDLQDTSCKQRLNFILVNDHILSYVMDMVSIKSTDPIELEKLCLLKPKISEIEDLFKMMETDYRKLIYLLFVNNNFLTEIDEYLAYNYPITTQECMLSLTCENKSSKDSKSSSTPQKNEFVRVDGIFKKIAIIEKEEVKGEGVIQVEALKIVNKISELPSNSNKCNMSPSKSDKCISSSSKSDNCTLLPSNKFTKSPLIVKKCTSSKSNECTTSPSISKQCTSSSPESKKCTASLSTSKSNECAASNSTSK